MQKALDTIEVRPANEASWEDLQAVFGERGDPHFCQCQRYKLGHWGWTPFPQETRAQALREEAECGQDDAESTSGLIAYLDGEPAGWCNVEPRVAFPGLRTTRVPWPGRKEDKDDPSVWSVTCFVVRAGYRGRGLTYALAAASVDFARERGARALEGYPMIVPPGREITWGELFVGKSSVFAAAGFREVNRPTKRRVVMRIDFAG
ncbi:MAG TPA: GNAT family N-acetyltransferase [Actinospica sp.]|jgi:GNAT superfamily N-acetyltransferase|nr:GNAT family N-acetyltransferase [Actinospica sp.]